MMLFEQTMTRQVLCDSGSRKPDVCESGPSMTTVTTQMPCPEDSAKSVARFGRTAILSGGQDIPRAALVCSFAQEKPPGCRL